jgi:hypothetical protein
MLCKYHVGKVPEEQKKKMKNYDEKKRKIRKMED